MMQKTPQQTSWLQNHNVYKKRPTPRGGSFLILYLSFALW